MVKALLIPQMYAERPMRASRQPYFTNISIARKNTISILLSFC
ncbi:hypothetical protein CEV33_2488 [Brucella grignonensis]|uniref:Uncharacterized protein n=1 Tax=Brucella grignonensis TaxID=94627 RepID=A0A256F859_9HYPH|nr:hypothetical protein CEV33_2488 [Brucella grignonensis]